MRILASFVIKYALLFLSLLPTDILQQDTVLYDHRTLLNKDHNNPFFSSRPPHKLLA